MSRAAVAILSRNNLIHNIAVVKNVLRPSTKLVAMVKANAYGHGIRSVSKIIDGYVDVLGVASIDEAQALREAGISCAILLAEGVFEQKELHIASRENFHVVFHNEHQLLWLKSLELSKPISAWLKVDTGMGRLGFRVEDADKYYYALKSSSNVKDLVVMSHFACADQKDHFLNKRQIDLFQAFVSTKNSQFSMCNSAAIFNFHNIHYDYVRAGLALYGVSPIQGVSSKLLNLKPVMTLQSTLISIKKLNRGDSVGYGSRYVCQDDKLVGIIAFGYGDGYPITAQDGAPILVKGAVCNTIGRVSMDMLAVDLSNCSNPEVGDVATLWGEGLPIEDVVPYTSNITYDMLTGVQNRVKFIWQE